jgi:hypothetical protein
VQSLFKSVVDIEHCVSTRRQGICELLQLVAMLLLFFAVYKLFFAGWVWIGGQKGFLSFVIVVGLLSIALAAHALWGIVQNRFLDAIREANRSVMDASAKD